uniref:Ig-like domain-containing protein n=1 Tax=Rattus norvegicus TaxID=10116 RepID=A0ABK0LP65_RAT
MPPYSLLCVLMALALSGFNVAQEVTQVQSTASWQEREEVTLDCSYETSQNIYHLFWYKQLLSGDIIFLIRQTSFDSQNQRSGRYSVVFQKSLKSISLVISASQPEDSGKYFCALWELTQW